MSPTTTYLAKVSKDVKDGVGASLGADFSWSFTTIGRRWGPVTEIGTFYEDSWDPDVAMNGTGEAVVTWTQGSNATMWAFARVYTPADGWSISQSLDPGQFASTDVTPRAVMDSAGNALVIWKDGFNPGRVQSRRYLRTGGWQPLTLVDDLVSWDDIPPRLLMAPGGEGRIFFPALNPIGGGFVRYGANRGFSGESGWGDIETVPVGYEQYLNSDVGVTEAGQFVAIHSTWNYGRNGQHTLRVYWHVNGTGWLGDSFPTYFNQEPDRIRFVLDADANMNIVWRAGTTDSFVTARYFMSTGWTSTSVLPVGGPLLDPHDVVADSSGNAFLLWTEEVSGTAKLRYRRFAANTGMWSEIQPGPSQAGSITTPVMSGKPDDAVGVVWAEFNGTRWVVRGSRWLPEQGWEPTVTIGSDANFDSFNPKLAVGSDGRATAVWLRGNNPPYHVMASRFD